jgi:hypothetical protein
MLVKKTDYLKKKKNLSVLCICFLAQNFKNPWYFLSEEDSYAEEVTQVGP